MGGQPDQTKETPLLDRVAEAIYRVQVENAAALVAQYDFQLDRLQRVFNVIPSESDRSLAVLVFALAEDLMLCGLEFNMKANCPKGWETATSGNGVLATASDRISILELLAWITPAVASQLRLMKNIRNHFAHHADVNGFADQKIAGWVSSMEPSEKPIIDLIPEDRRGEMPPHSPREQFVIRATVAIISLVTDIAVLPAASAFKVLPRDVIGGGDFDKLPDPLKQLRRVAADVALTCMPRNLISTG